MLDNRECAMIILHTGTKKERSVWRWIRNRDGFKYILYKGDIWTVERSKTIFNAYTIGRLVVLS